MFRDILRVILSMLFVVALLLSSAPAARAGCGGGKGLFGRLKARIQERRQARQSGGNSAGDPGQDDQANGYGFGYSPQQSFGYGANPVTYATGPAITIPQTDIPMPAVKAGAVAVYDGKTWRLVETQADVAAILSALPVSSGFASGFQSAPSYYQAAPVRYYAAPQSFGYGFGSGECVGSNCSVGSGRQGFFRR